MPRGDGDSGQPVETEMLRVLNRESLATQAADQLIARIESGAWKVGERLPAERTLCEHLGVGRTSVGEALRILAARGYVNVRAGRGTFVASAWSLPPPFSPYAEWSVDHEFDIAEVVDVRKLLEGRVAELAAGCATDEDGVRQSLERQIGVGKFIALKGAFCAIPGPLL